MAQMTAGQHMELRVYTSDQYGNPIGPLDSGVAVWTNDNPEIVSLRWPSAGNLSMDARSNGPAGTAHIHGTVTCSLGTDLPFSIDVQVVAGTPSAVTIVAGTPSGS